MICSKHVDVKRHSVCFPEIEKTFAVSSLFLNLFASQIGEFFLPHPVHVHTREDDQQDAHFFSLIYSS